MKYYAGMLERTLNISSGKFVSSNFLTPICNAEWRVAHHKKKRRITLNPVRHLTEAATCSARKVVLRNFAKFTGKHLCQGLFLISCRPQAKIRSDVTHLLSFVFLCYIPHTAKNLQNKLLFDNRLEAFYK